MAQFGYERIEDKNEIVAVTWNDCTAWICDNSDMLIWKELLQEQNYKVIVLSESEFVAKVKQSLGLN